jgi:ribokinase
VTEPRLFVLGNASLDTTVMVPRLPAPGETLMATGILRSPGGKGLNQAVVASRAGAAVHFCAPLGNEPETMMVRDALAGLASVRLCDVGQPTDLSSLMVAPDGENCIISTGACADGLSWAQAAAFLAEMGPDDWLLLQGNLTEAVTRQAAAGAARVILNTAPLRWDYAQLLPHCDVVVSNRVEAASLTGLDDPEAAAVRLAGTGSAIVTLGAEGCVVARGGVSRHPAPLVAAIDSSGAGDVFCGMLAACLVRGLSMTRAVEAAQAAAGLSVGRAGCFPSFPTPDELAAISAR